VRRAYFTRFTYRQNRRICAGPADSLNLPATPFRLKRASGSPAVAQVKSASKRIQRGKLLIMWIGINIYAIM
jgi:hypothetical protein